MMTPRMLAIAVVLLALAAPVPSAADSGNKLADAREHLDKLDYHAALRVLQEALAAGSASPEQMHNAYRMLGQVHAALGHMEEAERFFRNWLALQPGATLPEGTSPKIARPYALARTRMSRQPPLDARCTADPDRSAVVVEVVSDPLELVRGAQARYRTTSGAERTIETTGGRELVLILPIEQRAQVVCSVIDEHGNHLVEIGSWDQPLVLAPAAEPEAPPPPPPASRSLFGRWYLWSTMTVAAGGASVYFAMLARADQEELDRIRHNSSMYQYTQAQEVERRGQRNALLANISMGVAGVTTVAAVVTLLRSGTSEPPEVAITPLITADSGGLLVQTLF